MNGHPKKSAVGCSVVAIKNLEGSLRHSDFLRIYLLFDSEPTWSLNWSEDSFPLDTIHATNAGKVLQEAGDGGKVVVTSLVGGECMRMREHAWTMWERHGKTRSLCLHVLSTCRASQFAWTRQPHWALLAPSSNINVIQPQGVSAKVWLWCCATADICLCLKMCNRLSEFNTCWKWRDLYSTTQALYTLGCFQSSCRSTFAVKLSNWAQLLSAPRFSRWDQNSRDFSRARDIRVGPRYLEHLGTVVTQCRFFGVGIDGKSWR